MVEADELYRRTLEMDPTCLNTLTHYATFLHRKKGGEMQRAESFYKRYAAYSLLMMK